MTTKLILSICLYGLAHFLLADGNSFEESDRDQQQDRFFFGGSGSGSGQGGFFGLGNLFSCRPFNRTFVQTGVPCMQPNLTALNCRNQTCVCSAISLPNPGIPGLPSPPFQMPFSMWNCTSVPTSTVSPTPSTTTSTTTLRSQADGRRTKCGAC